MRSLKLKVCGMRYPENIQEIIALNPDFMGFIFYEKSARFVGDLIPELVKSIPAEIKKVGVFVNASLEQIEKTVKQFQLDFVQLHGDESLEFAREMKNKGVRVIKVFRVKDQLPAQLASYEGVADYLLLDTAGKEYGGTGKHFDWKILQDYHADIPLLLSGGLSLNDIEEVKLLQVKRLYGIDINSRFELAPAVKDVKMVEELINQL